MSGGTTKTAPKSARRRAREYALQGIYQWLLSGGSVHDILGGLAEHEDYARADGDYCKQLLFGVVAQADALQAHWVAVIDRAADDLSPIERGILLLATYELVDQPEIPYRVVINEAIELAKTFGGTDGHKYVNGVLDKIAPGLRPHEKVEARRPQGARREKP